MAAEGRELYRINVTDPLRSRMDSLARAEVAAEMRRMRGEFAFVRTVIDVEGNLRGFEVAVEPQKSFTEAELWDEHAQYGPNRPS